MSELISYRIGGVLGYMYVDMFKKAGIKLDLTVSDKSNYMKLNMNRLDLVIADKAVGMYLIDDLYPKNKYDFGIIEQSVITGNSHLMISRKYPDSKQLRIRFNNALNIIIENGTYQSILQKYDVLPTRREKVTPKTKN